MFVIACSVFSAFVCFSLAYLVNGMRELLKRARERDDLAIRERTDRLMEIATEGKATASTLPHICCVLGLSDYHVRNLRWLLCMAYDNCDDEYMKAKGLDTGDWCGELRWELEEFMKNNKINSLANTEPNFPLVGWSDPVRTRIGETKTVWATTVEELVSYVIKLERKD